MLLLHITYNNIFNSDFGTSLVENYQIAYFFNFMTQAFGSR